MLRRITAVATLVAALAIRPAGQQQKPAQVFTPTGDNLSYVLTLFEQYLESLRQQAGIPGLSAAIVSNGQIIWERGLGFQDVESAIRATPDTPYEVGDLTQALAGTLVMQCVELDVDLDGPIGRLTSGVPDPTASLRHVLSHTSDSPPGTTFRFSRSRFATLSGAVERCFGTTFRARLASAVLDRSGMRDSVPGTDLIDRSVVAPGTFSNGAHQRYEAALRRLARAYRVDRRGKATPSQPDPAGVTAAGGVVSTVRDLSMFSAALDDRVLLSPDSLSLAWNNATSATGRAHPTGLGWFVQPYNGERIVWHFGEVTDAYSSLLLKVPGRRLALVLLANSDGLSSPFDLAAGDVTSSLFAKLFLSLFV